MVTAIVENRDFLQVGPKVSVGPYKLRVTVDPKTEREPLAIRVELPNTGRDAWPFVDVEVRDARSGAIAVRRNGTGWQSLLIPVPAVAGIYLVQAVDPPGGRLNQYTTYG